MTAVDKQPPPKPAKPPSVSSMEEPPKEEDNNSLVVKEEQEEKEIIDDTSKEEVSTEMEQVVETPKQEEEEVNQEETVSDQANEQMSQNEQSEPPAQTSSIGDIAVDPDKEINDSMGVLFKVYDSISLCVYYIMLKVIALHPYTGEDEDELSFEKGDVICVVPYEDPEDEVCVIVMIFII